LWFVGVIFLIVLYLGKGGKRMYKGKMRVSDQAAKGGGRRRGM
jgi:hypothetical protein